MDWADEMVIEMKLCVEMEDVHPDILNLYQRIGLMVKYASE